MLQDTAAALAQLGVQTRGLPAAPPAAASARRCSRPALLGVAHLRLACAEETKVARRRPQHMDSIQMRDEYRKLRKEASYPMCFFADDAF